MSFRERIPSSKQYLIAAKFLSEITGLRISVGQAKKILAQYPGALRKTAEVEEHVDTVVGDELAFAVAQFFLQAPWPNYGDQVDISTFLHFLRKEAMELGYEIGSR